MGDKDKKGTSTLSAIIAFALIAGIGIWLVMIFTTQGAQRLEQACKPVEYSTQKLHEFATVVAGRQPVWTLYVQRYLVSGCYYTFSILFTEQLQDNPLSESSMTLEQAAPDANGIH